MSEIWKIAAISVFPESEGRKIKTGKHQLLEFSRLCRNDDRGQSYDPKFIYHQKPASATLRLQPSASRLCQFSRRILCAGTINPPGFFVGLHPWTVAFCFPGLADLGVKIQLSDINLLDTLADAK
jgi:hypothetical protein